VLEPNEVLKFYSMILVVIVGIVSILIYICCKLDNYKPPISDLMTSFGTAIIIGTIYGTIIHCFDSGLPYITNFIIGLISVFVCMLIGCIFLVFDKL